MTGRSGQLQELERGWSMGSAPLLGCELGSLVRGRRRADSANLGTEVEKKRSAKKLKTEIGGRQETGS